MIKIVKSILLSLVLLLSFSACAADDKPHLEATLLQGNPSGTWFALSNAISEAVSNSYPESLINITPGDVVPNVIRLGNVEADFALTHNYVASAALKGEFPFDTPIENIGSVASFYPSSAQLFLSKDLGISTFREIIDNRVPIDISIGKKGELVEESFYQLLREYGITKEEMEGWGCTFANAGHSDGGLLFADGVIDGYYVMVSSPSPVVMENSVNKELVMVEFDADVVASMCEKYGYSAQTIAAGVYPFMDKDVQVYANYTILLASLETPEESVYMMTKSLYENMEYLKLSHAALQDMTQESMLENLGIPLHPGAERYYKEAGLLATRAGKDEAPVFSTLLQSDPSGVWLMLSNGIAECLNKTYPGSLLQVTPGAPVPNVSRLIAGEAEFILTHNHAVVSAVQGTEPFTKPNPEVKAVMAFYPSPAQMVLRADLGVASFDEIIDEKTKIRITIGKPGGNAEEVFQRLLKQYGISKEAMEEWGCEFLNKSPDETQQMFSDGAIDGYFFAASSPQPNIIENALNNDMVLVDFNPAVIRAMCAEYGMQPCIIPSDTYSFLQKDYQSFADYTILATSDAVSEETVYKLTRAIHENLDYINLVHAALKDLDEETMAEKVKIPLHAGAERYYKEIGIL